MFKNAPVNGLAWPAGAWSATFTGANKTDHNATCRTKVNYALLYFWAIGRYYLVNTFRNVFITSNIYSCLEKL